MPTIADEGWLPILIAASLAVAAVATLGWLASLPVWCLAAFVIIVFHVPRIRPTDRPVAVVSPAAGQVVRVGPGFDPWLKRYALGITIELGFPGIGVVFSPVNGKVDRYWTDLVADEEEHGDDWVHAVLESPRRYALGIDTDTGDEVVYAISSARRHSRLKFDHAPGERAARARRSGFVFFASRVDVFLPPNVKVLVAVGERVDAGSSVVADLVNG